MKASCIRLRSLVVPAMLLLMLWCGTTHAQKLWDGESAANDNWSTGQNWDGDTSPPNPYSSGTINFNNTDLGNQNVVDANWTIATLWYTNSVWGQGHTTDLGGNELVVQSALVCGGNPDVVYNNSVAPKQATANTEATLQNGALQLGTASLAANVIVGYLFQYGSYPGGAFNPTNNTLTIAATVGCTNLSSFYIGFRDYICSTAYGEGTLDLSGATINSPGKLNTLKAANMYLGRGSYHHSSGRGTVKLPTSLRNLELSGNFHCAWGYSGGIVPAFFSRGTLDFGAMSSLTNLYVGGIFDFGYMGASGILNIGSNSQLRAFTADGGLRMSTESGSGRIGYYATGGQFVDYLPTGLVFTVGKPTAYANMYLGTATTLSGIRNTGTVTLVNGTFRGYLNELRVGYHASYYGDTLSLLDLSSSSVQIGDEPNKVKIARLVVGGGGNDNIYGGGAQEATLRLPPSVTQVIVGHLEVGVGGGTYTARPNEGTLDFGAGSSLSLLSVTNAFWMGSYNAKFGRITGLPTNGLTVALGQPSQRIPVHMGYKVIKNYDESRFPIDEAILRLTNANFSAYLTNLIIGVSDNTGYWGGGDAELTLEGGTMSAFDVSGAIRIGQSKHFYSGMTKGFLNLPVGSATCGDFFIGGTNTSFSSGVVKLHSTEFTVTNSLLIDLTGRLTNDMAGVSGGIDIVSTDTNDFVINAGGLMHLVYDQDPSDPGDTYWSVRMTGDQRQHFEWLHAQGCLTWDTALLDAQHLPRFGIHYSNYQSRTFVGLREQQGTLILLN